MRIIGGKHKGVRLKSRKSNATRPLLARVKKSLFSIILPRLEGARFLDLFAGTGAVGIEALSRGAALCYFVDQNEQCCIVIRDNLKLIDRISDAHILRKKVSTALNLMEEEEKQFDIIFVGPPYDTDFAAKTITRLGESSILHEDTTVIAEVRKNTAMPQHAGYLVLNRTETYGDTSLLFYQYCTAVQ